MVPDLVRERPGDYVLAMGPSRVWVTLADGKRMMISKPEVISDSIVGWSGQDEVSVPLHAVKEMNVRKLSPARSAVVGAVTIGLGVTWLATHVGGQRYLCTSKEHPDEEGDVGECVLVQ
jgi:fructose-specific phosphotransferase system IIC component